MAQGCAGLILTAAYPQVLRVIEKGPAHPTLLLLVYQLQGFASFLHLDNPLLILLRAVIAVLNVRQRL